jgi:tRNA A58 N-methylase Trm61
MLVEAGIGPGAWVLDAGTGAGNVALEAARHALRRRRPAAP